MMESQIPVLESVAGLRHLLKKLRSEHHKASDKELLGQVGLVPTMGALHAGHLSLIQRARQENAIVVVSIFVNPLQFGPMEDFGQYPRTLESDLALCQQVGVNVVFVPQVKELVSTTPMTQVVPPASLMEGLCGRSRPGHFQGVATIVLKLLGVVQPDRAYFGQKDAQQLAIIQRMVQDLNLATTVVPCPILREPSGLALSSRNQYLNSQEKQQATVLYRGLSQVQSLFQAGIGDRPTLLQAFHDTMTQESDVQLEYADLVDPYSLQPLSKVESVGLVVVAARVGKTRLIDNLVLDGRKPILAIDGPAGAGKSTVTRHCAAELGLLYLDTGAMYRAMTWLVLQSGIALEDEGAIATLVTQAHIELKPGVHPSNPMQVWVNGQDVTTEIRSREVTAQVSAVSSQSAVREILGRQQKAYGEKGGVAAEGRDMGTHVFPEAGLKIFLTATVEERARRRYQELRDTDSLTLEKLAQEIAERDRQDSQREIAPLRKATDAIEVLTDGLSIDEVVQKIVDFYRERFYIERYPDPSRSV
jgi:pantoate ligase / CMP/dCMP kinase